MCDQGGVDAGRTFSSYSKSCAELVQSILSESSGTGISPFDSLPMPYDYYQRIAYSAFEYAEYLSHPEHINVHYTDFIGTYFPDLNIVT